MFDTLFRNARWNAALGWIAIGILVLAGVLNLADDDWLWAGFALASIVLALTPAAVTRDWQAMVPWPLVTLLAGAVVAHAIRVAPRTASSLAIATLALVFVVELVTFTPVRLSHRFAVVFAVMTTLALEAMWIIVRYYADVLLETGFLISQTAVQESIVLVTLVSIVVGIAFQLFFHWFEPAGTLDRSTRHTEET